MVNKTRSGSHTCPERIGGGGGSTDLPVDRIIIMRAELDDFKSEMRSLLEREEEVTRLKSEVSNLMRAKVLKLEVKIIDTDAYECRDTI